MKNKNTLFLQKHRFQNPYSPVCPSPQTDTFSVRFSLKRTGTLSTTLILSSSSTRLVKRVSLVCENGNHSGFRLEGGVEWTVRFPLLSDFLDIIPLVVSPSRRATVFRGSRYQTQWKLCLALWGRHGLFKDPFYTQAEALTQHGVRNNTNDYSRVSPRERDNSVLQPSIVFHYCICGQYQGSNLLPGRSGPPRLLETASVVRASRIRFQNARVVVALVRVCIQGQSLAPIGHVSFNLNYIRDIPRRLVCSLKIPILFGVSVSPFDLLLLVCFQC